MLKQALFAAALGFAAIGAAPVAAQSTTPYEKTIQVTYTGIVVNDDVGAIMIRQPDGSLTPYTGPKPDYPYRLGDTVTMSFETLMPTRAFFEANPTTPYNGQEAVDGVYKFQVTSFYNCYGPTSFGCVRDISLTGGLRAPGGSEPLGTSGLVMVYDSNTDQYYMELAGDSWQAGAFNGPGYNYDPATGTITSSPTTGGRDGDFLLGLIGTLTDIAFSGGRVINSQTGYGTPYLYNTPKLSGSFNLPTYGSSGATDVPAPPVTWLFGIAVLALGLRMERRRQAIA